ncbi:MAG: nitrilase-related carbon-nitrogen hydrolase [Meiothermus sp.]|uniref:nitrilase-related carbon-nitrogen hydrolase n=1 Tax=Meiothermus sp. TaxID=1955249 RepID=UPI00298F00D2|nr:nitrilase-related carbon-nitrogen hydrolase [Meiothermus sp.]MDW8426096.1 nitrilase-related carbon-nitrogen hydrolase [Meiothermus sp.]
MRVHLIAVQAELQTAPYTSAESFRQYVLELSRGAVQGLPEDQPRILAFPEAFALPLVFWLETSRAVLEAQSGLQAALQLLREHWPALLRQGVWSPAALYHLRAPWVWPVYEQAFREAAQAVRAYIVGGSIFSPQMDWEPARRLHAKGKGVYNLSLVVSPQGSVLGRVPKVHLTASERKAFLTGGPPGRQTLHTRLGTLANLICLDAFHDSLIEQADAAGAWLVVQPSANAARWEGPWSADPREIEGQVWLREGLAQKLQNRENLRYGLNPMLNGHLYDLYFEGKSGIYQAGGPLALAKSAVGNAFVRAEVEVPDAPGR